MASRCTEIWSEKHPRNPSILRAIASKTRCFTNAPKKTDFPGFFTSRFVENRQQFHVLAPAHYFCSFTRVSRNPKNNPQNPSILRGIAKKTCCFLHLTPKLIFFAYLAETRYEAWRRNITPVTQLNSSKQPLHHSPRPHGSKQKRNPLETNPRQHVRGKSILVLLPEVVSAPQRAYGLVGSREA